MKSYKTKTHSAALADRYTIAGTTYLRVRAGNGPTLEVKVPADAIGSASRLYGGDTILFAFRGGRPVYVPA